MGQLSELAAQAACAALLGPEIGASPTVNSEHGCHHGCIEHPAEDCHDAMRLPGLPHAISCGRKWGRLRTVQRASLNRPP